LKNGSNWKQKTRPSQKAGFFIGHWHLFSDQSPQPAALHPDLAYFPIIFPAVSHAKPLQGRFME